MRTLILASLVALAACGGDESIGPVEQQQDVRGDYVGTWTFSLEWNGEPGARDDCAGFVSIDTLAGATLSGRIGIYQGGGNCNEWSKDMTGTIQPDGSFSFTLDESMLGDCELVSGSESFIGSTDGTELDLDLEFTERCSATLRRDYHFSGVRS